MRGKTIGALAVVLLSAACGKAGNEPAEAASAKSELTQVRSAAPGPSGRADCPFAGDRSKGWEAKVDMSPPMPEGGRPLGLAGMAEVTVDGISARLTPGELEGDTQFFVLEALPEATSRKGWRTVSTSVYPAPAATKAAILCNGKVLHEEPVRIIR